VADGGGRTASTLFGNAGFQLSYAQRQPGFVCRVNGVPASDPCQNTAPASAYWGLWSSTGDPGSSWTYASLGAGSLTVPDGGLVAFSWDDVGGDAPPSAPASRPQAPAPPTGQPTGHPTSHPTSHPPQPPTQQPAPLPTGRPSPSTAPGATTPADPTTSAAPGEPASGTAGPSPSGRPHRTPGAAGTATTAPGGAPTGSPTSGAPSTVTTVATSAEPSGGGGLPGWVAPAVIVVLLAGVGTARARRSARLGRARRDRRAAGRGRCGAGPPPDPAVTTLLGPGLPRDLHPAAWWLWALGLAAAASLTSNPFLLLMIVAVTALVVVLRRADHPWSRSFRLYLWLGAAAVVIRVVSRVLLGGGYPGTVLLDLPRVPLPHWVAGVTLLGPLTREALLSGLYDGLRLGTIVVCVGAANSLANPKRLLRSMPPALYEIGTALVVAVTVLPQLTDSARRVRAAQALRAGETGRVRGLRRVLVPVLEDTLERSLALAAGMDARGYGRTGDVSPAQRRLTGTLLVGGLMGVCVGVYAGLDTTAPRYLATPLLVAGLLAALAGFVLAGARVQRTVYRPDRWRAAEVLVAASGVAAAVGLWWVGRNQLTVGYPDLATLPPVSLTALVAALVGLLAVVVSPPPALDPAGPAGPTGPAGPLPAVRHEPARAGQQA
jgi:energy-coupling factor transport system permease protein